MCGKKVYFSPIIDLFDGTIIAATHAFHPTTTFTAASLAQAIAKENPQPGLIVHTDQGFHYQHVSWRNQLDHIGAVQSMSRKGNCYANSLAENFFSHLKAEFYHPSSFTSVQDFLDQLDQYITWYNNNRIQERLKGLTPIEYRNQALAA
ncbi:IS3 family transposase [Arcanobacterium phocisimile]|uniref:IS3 family transposase n=1 Tax=Arcanobacterium phocisimile TaxID=1302235 RepID=A0ABX7IKI9_9ACTO|nr:IS3 family transposase [Arcanobacterium phocisimile]QRV02348.1 IS3 family transposase [Arcanobacterium phocisimile]QRV02354.1 IS3 family transposase [Arcanobacterium phocisimile]